MEIKIKKEELVKGRLVEVSKSPKIIAYFDGEKYFAFSGICPHAKWPLELGFVKENTLTCGGHGWEFNIEKGQCITNPGRDLQIYTIREEGEDMMISKK
jgi:nitrite reductase/ring-hydroxylating ferredoxin subunit